MDLKGLFNKGKKIVDERGGVNSLKDDAQELQKIAKGKGSLADKAKEAAAAIKDPGAPGGNPGAKHQPGQGRHAGGQHQPGQHQGQHKPGQGPNRP